MKKTSFILVVSLVLCFSCSKSSYIVYNYDNDVQRAILQGVDEMRKLNPIKEDQSIYAVIYGNIETSIVLNSQAKSREPIRELIAKSSRLIQLGDTLSIPVLFISDIESVDAQEGKLYELPYTGYMIILDRKNKLKKASLQF